MRAALRSGVDETNSAASPVSPAGDSAREAEMLDRLRGALARAPARVDPPSDAQPLAPSPREERRLTQEEVQDNVLGAFAKESPDPTWSRDASRALESSIPQALPDGARLLSVDCRATMCLVEIEYPDAKTAEGWPKHGFKTWHGAVFMAGDRDDRGAAVKTLVAIKEDVVPPYAGQ